MYLSLIELQLKLLRDQDLPGAFSLQIFFFSPCKVNTDKLGYLTYALKCSFSKGHLSSHQRVSNLKLGKLMLASHVSVYISI